MSRYLLWLLLLTLTACGPSSKGSRSAGQSPGAGGETGASGSTSAPDSDKGQVSTPTEPNVPFAMLGGGPRHLHRATVPGPKQLPREIARFTTGARIAASPAIGPDGTIYVGSLDGSFNALSRNGPLRWSYICDAPIFSTAAISLTGKVYVGCDDDHLLAFSTDGTFRWSYTMKEDVDSAPVIGDNGIIYIGGEGLHAVDGDGHRLFKVWLGGHVNAPPTVRPDGVLVVGSHDHRLYIVDPEGTVLASFETRGVIQGAAAALEKNDVVFGSDDGYVYRISPVGVLRWKFRTGGPVRAGIAVAEGEKTLFAASMDGAVYALQADNGKQIWRAETGGGIVSSPMLDSDGVLYVGSRDRHLYALSADTGEILWRYDLQCEMDATVAVASGRRLIAAGDDGAIRLLEEKP